MIANMALGIQGYNIAGATTSQVVRTLSCDTTMEACVGMVGGVICALAGFTGVK